MQYLSAFLINCYRHFPILFLFRYSNYRNRQTTHHKEELQLHRICYNWETERHCGILLCFHNCIRLSLLLWIFYSSALNHAHICTGIFMCPLIFLPLICIAAYTYLLFYVYRRANNMSHCKVVGRDNSRRLCKTIMLILVFQFILNIPGSLIIILYNLGIFPYCTVLPWLDLIWFNQNYVNGVIFLINHRKIEKRWTQNLRISIWRIFMIIWLIHSNTNNTHLKFSIIIEIHVKSSKNNHKPIWKFSSI